MVGELELPAYVEWILESLRFFALLASPLVIVGLVVVALRVRQRPVGAAIRDTARDLAVPLSVLLIVAFTLGPVSSTQIEWPTNLIPFADIISRMEGLVPKWNDVVDVVGNILLFIPFGLAVAWRWPAAPLHWVILSAIAVTGAIEATQAITDVGRSASTTDVVTNTIGAVVGYLADSAGAPAQRSPMIT